MKTHPRKNSILVSTCVVAAMSTVPAMAGDTSHGQAVSLAGARQHVEHAGADHAAHPKGHPAPDASRARAVQHLHFGNMVGARPRPGGLAQDAHDSMSHDMDMFSMQDGTSPPDARSADYSDGYRYTDMPGMAMADHASTGMLLVDHLEIARNDHGNHGAYLDAQAWYGRDFNKLWLKAEGASEHGKLEELRSELLWSHAVTAYWNTQLGVRHDFGGGPGRTWAAFGVQGLAPYWFETEATFYIGQDGRTAARLEFEYEARLTQRLILQPKLELNFHGKDDPQRGVGSGLSEFAAGLRLRYEVRRQFAPYVGVAWRRWYGRTADHVREQGAHASNFAFVAGLRFWF